MATYTIHINERTKTGRNLIEFLKSLKDIVTISSASGIEESLHDLRTGKVHKAKDANNLLKECLK
ncbi:hypothetical protein [Marinilabilia salmonicolor]|jgi:hypothetical protein|uniref:Uncharacterized protein n=1 Tax=Marinilabilia salmonicolor TaxID=989 RepID=A0A2T0XSX4_9BACT|nr:hypothetical protein [Marinilabilia salmonicolor]PRZ01996.1 hypothetical protein BY457_10116 [Marinilabilia salmonicolor]RCW39430.1 hypothetical protein DFO77_101200 [Marinilabilia salmonicolor]